MTKKLQKPIIIKRKEVDALALDLDGTLVDNMRYHETAWREFAKKHTIDFDTEWFRANCLGRPSRHIITLLFGDVSDQQQQAYYTERMDIYEVIFRKHATEIKGLTQFLRQAKHAGVKLALVTAGSPRTRELQLGHLKLHEGIFDHTIGSEHVQNQKPHPDPYRKAMQLMETSACLAFEDSPLGIESARTAGVHDVVGVLTSHTADQLGVGLAIHDYSDIRFEA